MFELICAGCGDTIGTISVDPGDAEILCNSCNQPEPEDEDEDEDEVEEDK